MITFLKNLAIDLALTFTLGAIVYCVMYLTDTTPEDIIGWAFDHIPTVTQERPKYL